MDMSLSGIWHSMSPIGKGIFVLLAFLSVYSLGVSLERWWAFKKAKQQSVKYTLFSIARLILALSLNIYFIAFLRLGIWGVLYSGLISSGLMALLLVLMAFLDVRISFSLKKLKSMLRYGIPLIHSGLGMFVLTFADRFFLQKYATLSDVGIFSLGYKLGMVIGALVVSPFLLFWAAYMYEIAEKPNAKYLFARIHVYYTFVLVFSSLGLSVLGHDVLKILTPPAFWEASQILPVIVLSYIVLDVNYFFHVGMNLYKKTSYLAYAVGGSALLNLLLNYLLIPPFHAWGAAWATLLSFVVMAAANCVLSQRLYPIQYEHSRLVKMLFMASAIFAVSKFIHIDSVASSVAIDLLLLATFPFMLWMVSFYRDDEIEMVRSFKNLIVGRMRVAL